MDTTSSSRKNKQLKVPDKKSLNETKGSKNNSQTELEAAGLIANIALQIALKTFKLVAAHRSYIEINQRHFEQKINKFNNIFFNKKVSLEKMRIDFNL